MDEFVVFRNPSCICNSSEIVSANRLFADSYSFIIQTVIWFVIFKLANILWGTSEQSKLNELLQDSGFSSKSSGISLLILFLGIIQEFLMQILGHAADCGFFWTWWLVSGCNNNASCSRDRTAWDVLPAWPPSKMKWKETFITFIRRFSQMLSATHLQAFFFQCWD